MSLESPSSFRKKAVEQLTDSVPVPSSESVEEVVTQQAFAVESSSEMGINDNAIPHGWMSNNGLAVSLEVSPQAVKKIAEKYSVSNPDWFTLKKGRFGGMWVHYSPELIQIITDEIKLRATAPEGWMTRGGLAALLGKGKREIGPIADRYKITNPEWFQEYYPSKGPVAEYCSPELVKAIIKEIKTREAAPEGWLTNTSFVSRVGGTWNTVHKYAQEFKTLNPDWFRLYKNENGQYLEHYAPELVSLIEKKLSSNGEVAPEGWMTRTSLVKKLQDITGRMSASAIDATVDRFRVSNPDFFKEFKNKMGQPNEHYSPELVQMIKNDVELRKQAPEGWLTRSLLSEELEVSEAKIKKLADQYRDSYPEWFGIFASRKTWVNAEHYSPQLLTLIREQILAEKAEEDLVQAESQESLRLKSECDSFFQDVLKGESVEASEFKKLLGLFGASNSTDILYRYHPEFKKVGLEYIKGSLAKYLGDFLVVRTGVVHEDLEIALPYLSDITLRETLYELLKKDCLSHYHQRKRTEEEVSDAVIFEEYIAELSEKVSSFKTETLVEIVDQVRGYYRALVSEYPKPENIVDSLKKGRPFPDINQKLNIREVQEKRKVLIGDEMGMGKSASAILSKEYLGVKKALVIVPSNVISTWQSYLSDAQDEEGNQIGYFEQGKSPTVLVIESESDLENIKDQPFDYCIVSQERMNERYGEGLKALGCDMAIIDEVHKLKNITGGQRSKVALDVVSGMKSENPYLVLLSGTPIPNKVGDVAILLKLLYPERFKDIDETELVTSIIHGDITDIRSLLMPRMQMKALSESVAMPEKSEVTLSTEISPLEKEVYELILEDDDLTASQKIQLLRRFVMNPASLDATPNIESSKIADVREHLHEAFEAKDKVVLIVNSYVDGIITGDENILGKFDIPSEIAVRVISGTVPKEERDRIQAELKNADSKMLLVVSGQTADVGVDFSSAEQILFYNDPWTKYDKQQQIARVYRPGLKDDLTVTTSVTEGTIEEGIAEYIELKYVAIQKILKGVPLTEIERELLATAEKQTTVDIEGDLEIARQWLNSPQNRLHKFFGATREIGEKKFHQFLMEYGEEYAQYYLDMGGRGFQANTSRIAGTLIDAFVKEKGQDADTVLILDSASGPEMLRSHIGDAYRENVISMDINQNHFLDGDTKKREGVGDAVVGSFVSLPFGGESFDYVNMSLAFHYSKLDLRKRDYERLKVLMEINRVLKPDGRVVLSMVHSLELKDVTAFKECVETLGFRVVEEFTGTASFGSSYTAPSIVLEKYESVDEPIESVVARIDKKKLNGLKFRNSGVSALKNNRFILNEFSLNGKKILVKLNQEDGVRHEAQQGILDEGRSLIELYGSIKEIPNDEIVQKDFLKIRVTKGTDKQVERYRLFKKSSEVGGFVEVLPKIDR